MLEVGWLLLTSCNYVLHFGKCLTACVLGIYTLIISLSVRYVLLKMGTATLDTFAYNTYKFCYNRDMTILYINFDWFTVPNKIDV